MAIQSAFTLTANEIYDTLANMIISQEVFADNLGEHQTLVDKARVDGGLYGDTKLYYATDVLKSAPWGNDAEAANLLALDRAEDPEVQAIKLDVFRQIRLTTDNYMTKRAFADEGAFSSFNGVMLGWLRETKRVYDGTLYNVFIGTTKAEGAAQSVEIDVEGARGNASTELEADKLEAFAIAQGLADLFVKMGDYSREFNDYGNLRSYAKEGIRVIWNSKFVNKIRKVDLPTIFHKDGLVEKFEEEILPARYFGTVITDSNYDDYWDDEGSGEPGKPIDANQSYAPGVNHANGCIRSMIEVDLIKAGTQVIHLFPGDELPAGVEILEDADHAHFGMIPGEVYIEQEDVICKVLVKLPPLMSAFEVGTTFFNPRSLTENHYLTFGHNTLAYLKNYPFITVSVK